MGKRKQDYIEFDCGSDFEQQALEAEKLMKWAKRELAIEPSERRKKSLRSLFLRQKVFAEAMRGDTDALMCCMRDRKMISEEKYQRFLEIKAEDEECEKQNKKDCLYG